MEVRDIVQEAVIKTIPKKKKCKKAKWLSEEALQIAVKRREAKGKGEKGRYIHLNGRRKWQPTPVFLPGKFHEWRSLVGYSSWGRKELDTPERLHFLSFYSSFWRRRRQPTPVFLPGESHGQRGLVGYSLITEFFPFLSAFRAPSSHLWWLQLLMTVTSLLTDMAGNITSLFAFLSCLSLLFFSQLFVSK